jgi:predicted ATP-grasp superfamily ATP-dependent carboligase
MFSSRAFTRSVPIAALLLVGARIANFYATRLPRRPVVKGYGQLPLVFEANRRQAPEQVLFLSRGEA